MNANSTQTLSKTGQWSVIVLVVLSLAAGYAGLWKLLTIVWIAFLAMALALPLGVSSTFEENPKRLVWGYGLSSGAMITSASVFLVPSAISYDPSFGGFGVATGLLSGFAIHTLGHWLSHRDTFLDPITTELSTHALAAGVIIGMVYSIMPDLGLLLGLAIISHKAPAGFAASKSLKQQSIPPTRLLLPASAVGLTALPMGLMAFSVSDAINGLVFGFATGVFLHLAMDFLPECEIGGDVYSLANLSEEQHHFLDRLRIHAVGSTILGGVIIFGLWYVIH
jgi:ZIP family zinc transporter